MNKYFSLFSALLLFNVCSAQWTQLNDIPFIDDHSNGFGFNGKGYIIKGTPNSPNESNQLWQYDPADDSWTELGFTPGPPRDFSIGDEMDGKFYFGFGFDRNDVWEYDPATNEFTELPSCPCITRGHPAFVAHNNKIFMGSGANNGDLDDWWVYDFETQTWEQKADMPDERHHPFQFGIGDAIYVGGGHADSWLRWDIPSETWSAIDDYPGDRVAGSQFSFAGKGFVIAGDDGDHDDLPTALSFLMYEPELDSWVELPFQGQLSRWAPSSFIIDNELYFFGGNRSNINEAAMWKFDLSTVGCIPPSNLFVSNLAETSVSLDWLENTSNLISTLEWRALGDANSTIVNNPSSNFELNDLEPCAEYEFRLSLDCDNETTYTDFVSFRTKGCGSCIDETFCNVSEVYSSESCFIQFVRFNSYQNITGDNEGYEEFTSIDEVAFEIGETFELKVHPATAYGENVNAKVWIDYNNNGDYEDDEQIAESDNFTSTFVADIEIPQTATEGISRMRIILSVNDILNACDVNVVGDGEVEDYCIKIMNQTVSIDEINETKSFNVSPNPFINQINIKSNLKEFSVVQLFDLQGQLIHQTKVANNQQYITWNLNESNSLKTGMYLLQVINDEHQIIHTEKVIHQ